MACLLHSDSHVKGSGISKRSILEPLNGGDCSFAWNMWRTLGVVHRACLLVFLDTGGTLTSARSGNIALLIHSCYVCGDFASSGWADQALSKSIVASTFIRVL